MRFDDRLLDDIKARIPPSRLIGRTVNLIRAGGSYKALSPFTKEKTPSFYVNDEKRIFKCFSSGLGGDIFKWLQLTEGLSFPEAVERLAAEAGVALPERDPEAAKRDQRKRELVDWMEAAQAFFAETLRGPKGTEARAYLERRGVPASDWGRFEIGYAPDAWEALVGHLTAKGAKPAELVAAGLAREGKQGSAKPYDYFRHRVTFAIRDPAGKLVGFGARALAKDEKAKYVNSPEGDLFKKGELLYRFPEARKAAALSGKEAARRGLIIVEGYMDAVALAQAGVEEVVASLGTALTPEQIDLAWRAGPRPTLLLDGDSAGLNAAYRVVDRVLPKLEPGRSMRFAKLMDGKDPDDVVRAEGRDGIRRVIDAAEPLDALMWERALAAHPVSSPDDAAELEEALRADVAKIAHERVRGHYRTELLTRFNDAYGYRARRRRDGGRGGGRAGAGRPGGAGSGWGDFQPGPLSITKNRTAARDHALMRDAVRLLAAFLDRPALIEPCAEALAGLEIASPELGELRDALVAFAEQEETVDKGALDRHLAEFGADMTASWARDCMSVAAAPAIVREGQSDAEARANWERELKKYNFRLYGREEMRDLAAAVAEGVVAGDRDSERRFAAAARNLSGGEVDGEDDGGDEAARETRARFDAALRTLEAAREDKKRKTRR